VRAMVGDRLRGAALVVALPFLLLAGCGGGDPPSGVPFPTLASTSLERACACVERNDCAVPEAADGRSQSETRNYQCRWDDRARGLATCSYESRMRTGPAKARLAWSRNIVSFRHGERGWCWADRASGRRL